MRVSSRFDSSRVNEEVGSSRMSTCTFIERARPISTSCRSARLNSPRSICAERLRPTFVRIFSDSWLIFFESIKNPFRGSLPRKRFAPMLKFSSPVSSWNTIRIPESSEEPGFGKDTFFPLRRIWPSSG